MQLDTLDIEVIGEAMYLSGHGSNEFFYLDTRSGMVVSFSHEVLTAALRKDEALLQKIPPAERHDVSWAEEILEDDECHQIPGIAAIDEFNWMADFSEMVSTPGVYESLRAALDVSAAMNEFHRILDRSPADREMWWHFLDQKKREEAMVWAEELVPCGESLL